MDSRPSSYEYEQLLTCGRGELFAEGPSCRCRHADVSTAFPKSPTPAGPMARAGARRTRDQAGPVVFCLPFQRRPGDARLSGARCALATGWIFLGWLGSPGRGRALGLGEVKFPASPSYGQKRRVRHRHQARQCAPSLCWGSPTAGFSADGQVIYKASDLKVGLFATRLPCSRPEPDRRARHRARPHNVRG